MLARERIDALAGLAFNIGGGPPSAVSLREVLAMIEAQTGARPEVELAPWRPGDQRWYVSDTRRFQRLTGWRPRVHPREGLAALSAWLAEEWAPVPRAAQAVAGTAH